jgi:hypothetical protein
MKNKIQPGRKLRNRLRTRVLILFTIGTFFLIIVGTVLVILNLNNLSKSRASATDNEGGGGSIGNGEVLCEFNWNSGDIKTATLGPDAVSCSKTAHIIAGGKNSTNGLAAGGREINLVIPATDIFKLDGIDISIDYSRSESSGDFFTRDNAFNFGFENGYLTVKYSTENKAGKVDVVKERTQFEIPEDPMFRTYRFVYVPTIGKAEVFVNGIIVWQRQGEKDSPLTWKNAGDIMIAHGIDGGESDRCVIDNLVIRNTESVTPLAESLLNFMLEARESGGVKIHWSTSANEKTDYFTIERSENGISFSNVAKVPVQQGNQDSEYTYTDLTPASTNLVYYRLRQTFQNGKFSTHALSAIRFKSEKGFSIERINPTPFDKTCDVSFYIPKPGRVWMQISNDNGNVVSTSTFEAPKGKNTHVFRDDTDLMPGTYTFSLIFEGKKLSAKIVKV